MQVSVLSTLIPLIGLAFRSDLSIDNFQAGETVRYPLVILRGSADGPEMAVGISWSSAIRFPVVNRRYTAAVELKPGKNMLLLHSGSESMKFRLDYRPMTGPYRICAAYIEASDEGNVYFSTYPHDRYRINAKMDLAMKLLQGFCADAMDRAGYGRKTFRLELDPAGQVPVHYFKSPKIGADLRAMDGNAIYSHVSDLLKDQPAESVTKWCAMMGFTGYDPVKKKSVGHLALGGGNLACFGGASMQWWPERLKELPKVLADATTIDPDTTFEDSGNRRTIWANVSTAYGAMMHEMGHTFGLPHSPDRYSVMSRGFDYFSRAFTCVESPLAGKRDDTSFKPDEISRWDPFFAARLYWSPWFQPDGDGGGAFDAKGPPKITMDGDDVTVEAANGLRVVGAENDGIPSWFSETRTGDAQRRVKLSRKDLRTKMQQTKLPFQIVAIDSNGNQTEVTDKIDN